MTLKNGQTFKKRPSSELEELTAKYKWPLNTGSLKILTGRGLTIADIWKVTRILNGRLSAYTTQHNKIPIK